MPAAPPEPAASRPPGQHGQASVELVAALPLVALVLAVGWQLVLAGDAVWRAAGAARAAARANALGGDAVAAARAALPGRLERGVRVQAADDGEVEVRVRVLLLGSRRTLTTVGADAGFAPQDDGA